MKRVIFFFTFVIVTNICYAGANVAPLPTYHWDTLNEMAYVNIAPVMWTRFEDSVKRLYLVETRDDLGMSGRFHWQVRSIVVIDPVTNYYKVVGEGDYVLNGTNYTDWDGDIMYIFEYFAALNDPDGTRINVTIVE